MLPSEKGLLRLVHQFQDSPKLKGLISAFISQFNDIDTAQNDLLTLRWVDTAQGAQLDGVGEIVGLSRPYTTISDGRFGFEGDDTARGFGDETDPNVGGNWFDEFTTRFPVDDDTYRLLIRAKIIKNSTAMTVDDTLRLISFTFGCEVRYFLFENLKPTYHIGKILGSFEKELLSTFPVLIGIESANYELEYNGNEAFGFAEDPNALGFGIGYGLFPSDDLYPSDTLYPDESMDHGVGGNFASLL